jgi:Ca2+-binding EF-hand superfamily protein
VIPSADVSGLRGAAPPEATELTREQRRFFRYDRNRDLKISRNEMLSSRTSAFRNLDTDGNNLITFEEFAVTTANRFDGADRNGDGELSAAEFATTAPAPRPSASPRCNC